MLLLELLLLLLLTLLHLLHDLLRRTYWAAGTEDRLVLATSRAGGGLVGALRLWWRWRLWRFFHDVLGHIFFIVILRRRIRDSRSVRSSCVPRAQNDLARSSLSQIAGQKDVVTRPLQKLIEHIPCLTRPVRAINALVLSEALDLCTGVYGHLAQYLLEA